jgi:hypothetical protein
MEGRSESQMHLQPSTSDTSALRLVTPSSLMGILGNSSSELYTSLDGGSTWTKKGYHVTNGSSYEERRWKGGAMLSISESLGVLGDEIIETRVGGSPWKILATAKVNSSVDYGSMSLRKRLFALDRRHGWFTDDATSGNKQLMRIGSA